jgi:hypothetical protein
VVGSSAEYPRIAILHLTPRAALAVTMCGAWLVAASVRADDGLRIVEGLRVSAVAQVPSGPTLRLAQPFGRKGPTSLRFFPESLTRRARPSPNPADPTGSRYLIKDRDLGQTFRTPAGRPFRLDAVTLRVGPAPLDDLAGIAGASDARVFLQVFEVTGTPILHDNGTTGTTTVSVSYPGKAMADDYVTGESYRSLLVATGGQLPGALSVGESNTPIPTVESAGTLLRFDIGATGGVVLAPDRRYAFIVGFEHPAERRALPIDNYDYLNQPGVAEGLTAAGPYADGHAIRREGRVEHPFVHLDLALSGDGAWSSFPTTFEARLRQQPGTWGRPDVDTYRDLVFWIEGTDVTAAAPAPGLGVTVLAHPPSGPRVVAMYTGADSSGNTSVAHDRAKTFKWSGASPYAHDDWGYFTAAGAEVAYVKRDRDLGQTFTYEGARPARLDAVTVQTGFGSNVVRPGTYGQAVSLQVFRVSGAPVLNDNGTTGTTRALHGFPHNRPGEPIPAERDDYFTGETYASLTIASGGRFPEPSAFGVHGRGPVAPGDAALKGKYLRFDVTGPHEVVLMPGETYAFLVMIDEHGPDRGFTLANHYVGGYLEGHGIRRDGNGVFPPAPANPARDFADPANAAALAAAHFPEAFDARAAIPPGTNGYPDVDTWRDLCFWVEVSPVQP